MGTNLADVMPYLLLLDGADVSDTIDTGAVHVAQPKTPIKEFKVKTFS